MKFVQEIDLRNQFWKRYGYRKNIIRYQFECQARHGAMDLVTIDKVLSKDDRQPHYEVCSFEFKLTDIDKAFAQAYENSKYCHKNFIVVPMNKKKTILDRYSDYFGKYPSIGCIAVEHPEDGGNWEIFHKAKAKKDDELVFNQSLIKLSMKEL
ncbi:hypothetical protein [Bulleidia sp. zg-1006]|uniref:hypothetical protein n=1 Tax=Bulleidia sp. zg-1006 TaxID=2806552 RepID=UPI001939AD01|nr:hypothetical protein [Bulleidia sp. zg-1006]QRG86943.1 hypothetical protein JOS54_01090 [Bulleidia sp. zg-1006]